jgi:hypothetical protein
MSDTIPINIRRRSREEFRSHVQTQMAVNPLLSEVVTTFGGLDEWVKRLYDEAPVDPVAAGANDAHPDGDRCKAE